MQPIETCVGPGIVCVDLVSDFSLLYMVVNQIFVLMVRTDATGCNRMLDSFKQILLYPLTAELMSGFNYIKYLLKIINFRLSHRCYFVV